MAIAGTIKTYTHSGFSFVEDVNGILRGFEWTKPNGNSFRVIYTNENKQLDLISKIIDFTYVKEMRESGDTVWFLKGRYSFDGSEYINTNFGNIKFGKLMNAPFQPDGVTLKANVMTFFDYFLNYNMKGLSPAIPLYDTLNDIAATKEGVTLP